MRITLVKKVLADGQDCRKCRDVMERLERGGYLDRIDRILVADERNPASAGWMAAQHYGVDTAPFFVVRHDDGREQVYRVFLALVRDVLQAPPHTPAAPDDEVAQLKGLANRDGLDRL
ncbi:hypothetical protein [Pseudomonas sp. TCU-HL1]|uniref:hypothetical protein n=1 Tax=Pseudomonas sp. TCU-HL1 TaxID=1856685 RepID=UPI00083D02AE|nr:hypothetical protein [Pseudomonas sp. TCU-HL1]AOE84916.1 hypothetical protein THL1_2368 [Pseudomonas sp. TCU-HL1]